MKSITPDMRKILWFANGREALFSIRFHEIAIFINIKHNRDNFKKLVYFFIGLFIFLRIKSIFSRLIQKGTGFSRAPIVLLTSSLLAKES